MGLTILMACLNKPETLKTSIIKANDGRVSARIAGEVMIANNGSTAVFTWDKRRSYDPFVKVAISCS